ncbi:MAG TPA: hypothetical protein VGR27_07620 [Longimicrobiaceae bacterium]|nr:hypothetical protein [Longimicrobiaceae bacterium]
MCILCNAESLRLLVAPLGSLSQPDLVESIRVAREAAMQLVLDTADALEEFEGPDAALRTVGPDGYLQYVVDRAEQDGVATPEEVREWSAAAEQGRVLEDPRVQAFLSSSTEGLAIYLSQIREKQAVLERFLELRPETTAFSGIGPHGEIALDHGNERYIVLSDEEAMQIAVDRISRELWQEDPALLLRYSNLPEDAIDLIVTAQRGPQEKANDILAGIIDLTALAEDTVRQTGYARFVAEGVSDDFTEQRFGDQLIIRLRLSGAPRDEY